MTGNKWADLLIGASLVLGALSIVWLKAIKPFFHFVRNAVRSLDKMTEIVPVLITIGEEFRPNGGHSLKDSLTRIETSLDNRGVELDELHQYSHQWKHQSSATLGQMAKSYISVDRKLNELAVEQKRVAAALGIREAADDLRHGATDSVADQLHEHRIIMEADKEGVVT